MFPYFIVFFIVMCLTVGADKAYKKNKKISYLLSGTSIVIICAFAGIRAYTVGTDISIYGLWRFNRAAGYSNIFSYLSISSFGTEYFYHGLNFVVNKLGGSFQMFLFILQLIPTVIMYNIAYKHRNKGTFSLYILAYMFLWFCSSLNILRQTPAMFIMLWAFKYIENGKYIKYTIATIIASFFHSSAIMCIIIPVIQYFSKQKYKYVYLCIAIVLILIGYFSLDIIAEILSKIPIFNGYAFYFDEGRVTNFKWYFAFLKLCMLAINMLYVKKIENKESNSLLIYMVWLDFILYCSSAFIRYGYRVSYYFLPYWILLIARIDKGLEKKKAQNVYRIITIILLVSYWITRYVIAKYDGVIPYQIYIK